jgi:hypothetical protein
MSTSTDLPGGLGADYAQRDEHRPVAAYSALSAAFGVALVGALAAARAGGREFPQRISAHDLVVAEVATHKVSPLLAKDNATSFLRAPFTRFQEKGGELEEEPRGTGLQHAIAELLVCPYFLAQWIAGGFAIGCVYAPRTTRLLAALWTIDAVADGVQLAYSAAQQRT